MNLNTAPLQQQLLIRGVVYEYSESGRGEPTLVKESTNALRDRYNNNAPSKVFVYVANGTPQLRIVCND